MARCFDLLCSLPRGGERSSALVEPTPKVLAQRQRSQTLSRRVPSATERKGRAEDDNERSIPYEAAGQSVQLGPSIAGLTPKRTAAEGKLILSLVTPRHGTFFPLREIPTRAVSARWRCEPSRCGVVLWRGSFWKALLAWEKAPGMRMTSRASPAPQTKWDGDRLAYAEQKRHPIRTAWTGLELRHIETVQKKSTLVQTSFHPLETEPSGVQHMELAYTFNVESIQAACRTRLGGGVARSFRAPGCSPRINKLQLKRTWIGEFGPTGMYPCSRASQFRTWSEGNSTVNL